jgi:hypothetical protein
MELAWRPALLLADATIERLWDFALATIAVACAFARAISCIASPLVSVPPVLALVGVALLETLSARNDPALTTPTRAKSTMMATPTTRIALKALRRLGWLTCRTTLRPTKYLLPTFSGIILDISNRMTAECQ